MASLITTSHMPTNSLVSQNPSQQTALGGAGGQVGDGFPGTGDRQQTPSADPDKRKLVQQQLGLLLHADNCQHRQQNNEETCGLPHCKTMKNVLSHMTTCNAGKSCQVAHCISSRQIITHWKKCTISDCPVCLPWKKASDQQQPGSRVGGQVGDGFPGTGDRQQTPSADPDKRKLIQQQLGLLLHADNCQQRQQNNEETCGLPHCKTMKNVLSHMTTCNAGKSCQVAHCISSRQIITHWKKCTISDCPVCLPWKKASDQQQPGSRVGGQVGGGFPGTGDCQQTPPADPDKIKLIQQQLGLLLHADNCQQRQQNNEETCGLPHCKTMKNVVSHMTTCNAGKSCQVAHCISSRKIITHWKKCTISDCPVCLPWKKASDQQQPGSRVGGQVGGGFPGTGDRQQTPPADPDKIKLIQQQLGLLLHADNCQQRQQNNGETCGLPHCKTMKNVVSHITTCNAGQSCQVAHCASSRQIITHWKNCTRSDCPVCLPWKKASDQKRPAGNVLPAPAGTATAAPAAPSQPVTTTQSLPNVSDIQMQMAYAALGLPYTGSSSQQSGHQQGGLNIRPPGSNSPGLSTMATGNQTSMLPSLSSGTNNPLGNLASIESSATSQAPNMAQNSRGTKEWYQSVTQDLRNHLVHKLVQAIFPSTDPAALKDRRMTDLVAYARKVEGHMYDTANSREEYYHLLAEKLCKIKIELEERLKTNTRSPGPNDPLLNTGGVPQPTQPFGSPRGPLGIDQQIL